MLFTASFLLYFSCPKDLANTGAQHQRTLLISMYPISMWPPAPKPTGCPCQAASLVCRQQMLRGDLSEQGRATRHKRCLLEAQASRKR